LSVQSETWSWPLASATRKAPRKARLLSLDIVAVRFGDFWEVVLVQLYFDLRRRLKP
jgi:hypothetical protein